MFPVSSVDLRPIAPALLPLAQRIEERSPGLHVLAARQFRYPVHQRKVGVRADQSRKINLLEKFILRASVEVSPSPSLEEIANALGLDVVFIRSSFSDLISCESIIHTENGLQVTEEGRKALSSETVSEAPIYETWYLLQDTVLDTATFVRYPPAEIDQELEDLSPYINKDLTQPPVFEFNLAALQPRFQELGLDLHDPDQDRFVTDLQPTGPPELCWKPIAIFVLYDTLSESADTAITLQARSEGHPIPLVAEWLESQLQEQNLSLKTLCGLTDDVVAQEEEVQNGDSAEEHLVEERLEEIRQQAISQLRLKVEGQTLEKEAGTAVQLRDVEIRPAFLEALQKAHEQIIIYSPWINEQVIDEAFLLLMENLVQQGIHVLIGYGIGRDESREERPIPPALRQRLRAIQTTEGTPGIIAEWLGNSHAKEIVIDRNIHFSGSHNWLSYRGDRFPRGETVYKVTIATEVEKAYNHLAHRFIERAKVLWSRAIDEDRRVALCILGYLGHEQEAVEWIQRDTCYHFIPLWLTLAQQAISARHDTYILAPLRTVITLCCTAIDPQDPLMAEIVTALRGVLKIMALKNQELTTNLVNDCLPELHQLGLGEQCL